MATVISFGFPINVRSLELFLLESTPRPKVLTCCSCGRPRRFRPGSGCNRKSLIFPPSCARRLGLKTPNYTDVDSTTMSFCLMSYCWMPFSLLVQDSWLKGMFILYVFAMTHLCCTVCRYRYDRLCVYYSQYNLYLYNYP